jgi:hypothetical protein
MSVAPNRAANFLRQCHAKWKYALSFTKSDWALRDYPLWMRQQEPSPPGTSARMRSRPFVVSIVNWHLAGTGDSAEEALADLEDSFEKVKAERRRTGEGQPRPGERVPTSFASSARIDAHGALAEDFIERVLQLPWAFLSDESALWDFHEDATNEAYVQRIRAAYGVDVSDLADAPVADILDRIAAEAEARS